MAAQLLVVGPHICMGGPAGPSSDPGSNPGLGIFFPLPPPLFFGSYCIVLLVLLRSLGIANNSTIFLYLVSSL